MNINKDHLLDAIIAGLLGGIIGARLYYVIFYPGDKYITNPMEIFNIKEAASAFTAALSAACCAAASSRRSAR